MVAFPYGDDVPQMFSWTFVLALVCMLIGMTVGYALGHHRAVPAPATVTHNIVLPLNYAVREPTIPVLVNRPVVIEKPALVAPSTCTIQQWISTRSAERQRHAMREVALSQLPAKVRPSFPQ
jgi:hypothetical protein